MTTIAREQNNISLEKLIEMAAEGIVIITEDNKPAFAFVPVDEEDLQTWRLGENAKFLELMRHSWDRLEAEGGISLEEAKRRLLKHRA
jgi:antitoxin (DNA-binding transcriptional repressor) of toxin-antitoxin stability system